MRVLLCIHLEGQNDPETVQRIISVIFDDRCKLGHEVLERIQVTIRDDEIERIQNLWVTQIC